MSRGAMFPVANAAPLEEAAAPVAEAGLEPPVAEVTIVVEQSQSEL